MFLPWLFTWLCTDETGVRLMTCKGICERHRALRPADGSEDILLDKKDVRYVRYLSSGRAVYVVRAVA